HDRRLHGAADRQPAQGRRCLRQPRGHRVRVVCLLGDLCPVLRLPRGGLFVRAEVSCQQVGLEGEGGVRVRGGRRGVDAAEH
ncbi:unnamed protein product, partial [Ectocarpus sp. 12 AP-2014]